MSKSDKAKSLKTKDGKGGCIRITSDLLKDQPYTPDEFQRLIIRDLKDRFK